jgi:hypothetical protein
LEGNVPDHYKTPAQAYDDLKKLLVASEVNEKPNYYGPKLSAARTELANAMAKQRELDAQGYGVGSIWPDIGRAAKNVPSHAITALKNLAGYTGGQFADMAQLGMNAWQMGMGKPPVGEVPGNSSQIIEALGGDESHPSALPMSFLAPGPGGKIEGLAAILSSAPTFIGGGKLEKLFGQLNKVDGILNKAENGFFHNFGVAWRDAPDPRKSGTRALVDQIYMKKHPGPVDLKTLDNNWARYKDDFEGIQAANNKRIELSSQAIRLEQLNQLDPSMMAPVKQGDLANALNDPSIAKLKPK